MRNLFLHKLTYKNNSNNNNNNNNNNNDNNNKLKQMRNLLLHKLTCLQVTILEERLCSLTSLQFFVQVPAIY